MQIKVLKTGEILDVRAVQTKAAGMGSVEPVGYVTEKGVYSIGEVATVAVPAAPAPAAPSTSPDAAEAEAQAEAADAAPAAKSSRRKKS
jgi:hypothetical protein